MEHYLPLLQQVSLFRGFKEGDILQILSCLQAACRIYPKGSCLLHSGDPVESVGLLLEGNAVVVQDDFWGNRNLLAQLHAGQLFGEAFACSPGICSTVNVVTQSSCTVMQLEVAPLLTTCSHACTHHQLLIRNLLGELAAKNLLFNEKLTHMGQRTTRQKLLSYFSAQAMKHGCAEFDIPFDRQQLADYLGVERSAMSAELSRLKKEGLLLYRKNHFLLHQ